MSDGLNHSHIEVNYPKRENRMTTDNTPKPMTAEEVDRLRNERCTCYIAICRPCPTCQQTERFVATIDHLRAQQPTSICQDADVFWKEWSRSEDGKTRLMREEQFRGFLGERGEAGSEQWSPMSSAPLDGTRILVDFGPCGIHAVSWTESISGTVIWCVDDQKHGPYPLRGYLEKDIRGWQPLPQPLPESQDPQQPTAIHDPEKQHLLDHALTQIERFRPAINEGLLLAPAGEKILFDLAVSLRTALAEAGQQPRKVTK